MRLDSGLLASFVALALAGARQTHASSSSGEISLRGVAPQDAHLYRASSDGKTWKCLHSGQQIAASAVNDDYCDCDDGSDEPGTSACPNSTFYCQNKGHIPALVRSNRVNDGVCDEYDGKVHCPDVCATVGKTYRKKRQEAENTQRAGSKIRDRYILERERAIESLQAEIAKLEVEWQVAGEKEKKAKAALEVAEAMDSKVIAQKMTSPLYGTLKSHQEALKTLMERQTNLKQELEKLTNLLDDLSKGYNPNYQDMAVKGAVMAYRSWRRGGDSEQEEEDGKEAEGTADAEEAVKLKQLLEEGEWTSARLDDMAGKDPLTLMDDENFQSASASHESGIRE
ncbi:hypothetical protein L7F22_000313 [Adiantum nelumboides]|nr:hypothetical protein [Adiantum nelumboides]